MSKCICGVLPSGGREYNPECKLHGKQFNGIKFLVVSEGRKRFSVVDVELKTTTAVGLDLDQALTICERMNRPIP